MKILVVEDEPKLGVYIRKGLTEEGFVVDLARTGLDGLHLAVECAYEVIVLDGGLPDLDGLAVLAALRQTRNTPVLMLTARQSVEDRVRGLDAGADDYLIKPFAFSELLARIRVLQRRGQKAPDQPQATVLQYLDLRLDLLRRQAQRGAVRLDLTPKEFALLVLLMRRQGEVLSRTEIAEQVWDMQFDSGTNVIDVAVRRLRTKIDDPFDRPTLHTVRGVGYVLETRDQ